MPLFDPRPLSGQPESPLPGVASGSQFNGQSNGQPNNGLQNTVQPLQNIAFVDAGLDHVETLIQGLENTQVVLINSDQDGIAQITSVLATQQNLDSVQIFSHGMEGSLQLGDAVLSGGTITGYSSQLEQWRAALTDQADVMLYGCNLASGDNGLALLSRISDLTGADVAASDDLTGQGGDWDLEVAVGSIEAAVALTQTAQATYEGTLALLNNGDFEQDLNGWSPFTGTETVSTAESFSGNAALQLSAAGSGVNQTLDVLVGETYTFTGNAKSSSSGYTAVGINFFDENYNFLDGASQSISVGDWQAFQLESTAVAGSRYVQFWAYKDTAAGDFFVDNLVADTDGVAPPPPPPPSGGAELLSNPGFENGLGSWSGFTGSEAASTAESFAGGSSLQLSEATSGTAQLIDTVVAGEEYTLSAYAKSSSTDYVGLGINFFDSNFNVLAGGVGQRVRSTDWQQYQATTTAPTGASYVQVWTYKSDGTGDAFLDEISLTFGGTTSPPSDTTAPTASLSASNVSAAADRYDFTVTYEDGSAVDVSSLDGSDIRVTGPNGFSQAASLVSVSGNGDGTPRIATYRITPPGGDWAAADNGTYAIALAANEVADTVGNTAGAATLGSFTVTVQDAPPPPTDTAAPTVSFVDAYVTNAGGTSYEFDIEFEDDTAVDVSTLTNNDIRVVGPNGFSQLAQFVSVNDNTDGPSRIATYQITPPGGSWDSADNGIYSVELLANQVSDTSGNLASAATLGNIDVTIEGRIDLGNLNAGVAARDSATGTGYLMYSDELLPVRFLDNPPYSSTTYGENANNLIAVVFQNGQWYYDDNSNLRAFSPRDTDLLLAELNFSADTASLLQGQNRLINGIRAGYEAGDLTVTPNVWNGSSSGSFYRGEFGVTGTYVTISDDGIFEGQLSFASSTVEVDEDAGTLAVTVNRTDGSDGQVTVDYATSGVSATPGQDFTSTSGTLVFGDGQTSRTIQVPIADDTDSEDDETFFINLSNPTGGATLGTSGTAVTILNDDAPPTPGNPGDLLPDLVPIASTLTEALRMDTTTISGRTILRLATEVANTGEGPLEIWGGSASGSSQAVFQRIYNDTGGSRDELAGEFVYHPSHGHIHFEGFATYSLRQVTAGNGVGSIVASGGKTSFCLINIRQPFPELTNAAQVSDGRGGDNCGQIQGIDVGYSDVYGANLPDQWIDVTNMSDGTYWLEAIADPDDNMVELDETNNVARVQITLNNGEVFA